MKRLLLGCAGGAAIVLLTGGNVWGLPETGDSPPPPMYETLALQPGELVSNGDAESGSSEAWTGGLNVFQHGVGGYPASVIVDGSGLTGGSFDGGTYLFVGAGAGSNATQSIDVGDAAAPIDNSYTRAQLSAFVGGYEWQNDHATVTFDFHDSDHNILSTVRFGPVLAVDRGGESGFIEFQSTVLVLPGTRSVTVSIDTLVSFGANDGYVDNVSLRLEAPVPVLESDTAHTEAGRSVVLDPLTNDFPGSGAVLQPDTLRLLVNGAELEEWANAEGTWTAIPEHGTVRFDPAPGFVGMTEPVMYTVEDTSGQRAVSSLRADVTPAAEEEETRRVGEVPDTRDLPVPSSGATPGLGNVSFAHTVEQSAEHSAVLRAPHTVSKAPTRITAVLATANQRTSEAVTTKTLELGSTPGDRTAALWLGASAFTLGIALVLAHLHASAREKR